MRARLEFAFHTLPTPHGHVDPTLALLGSQGWELRGISPSPEGGFVVALQRPLDEELPLPDAPTLAATLEEPLAMPTASTFDER